MKKFLFALILAITLFFRFYNLSSVPAHPSLDEVSIGYNAYSILTTGKDEYGTSFPILLRAYDDYRPALYVYLVIPFVKFFGLNAFSVRLPSAILSTIAVVCVYFLIKSLLRGKSDFTSSFFPMLGAFLVAVSPWDIYISRLGHEVNAFLSFFIFGLTLFFVFLKRGSKWYLFLSSFFLALSFDSYQSGKIVIPLITISLFILYFKKLVQSKKHLLVAVLIWLIVVSPFALESLKPNGLVRFKATNIISASPQILEKSAKKTLEAKNNGDTLGVVLNNRRILYAGLIIGAYFSHLNPVWLSTNGGDEVFKIPDFGLLYIFEIPVIFLGVYFLLKRNDFDGKVKIFFILWFAFSFIPGAITTGYPHAMRTIQIIPLLQIIETYALVCLFRMSYKNRQIKIASLAVFLAVLVFFVSSFAYSYFVKFKKTTAYQFQYGVIQAFDYAKSKENNYDQIVVSNKNNLFESYMFYLFSNKYDPLTYIKKGGTKSGGFAEQRSIGKYFFGNLGDLKFNKRTLVIMNPGELTTENINIIKKIDYPTGKAAIIIGEEN